MEKKRQLKDGMNLKELLELTERGEEVEAIYQFPMNDMKVCDIYGYLSYIHKEVAYMEVYKKGEEVSVKQLMEIYQKSENLPWAKEEKSTRNIYQINRILLFVVMLPSTEFYFDRKKMSRTDELLFYSLLIRPFLPKEEAFHEAYDFNENE